MTTAVRRWLPLLWLTAIAAVIGLLLLIPPTRAQLALSFTRAPTQFTELYFATDRALAESNAGDLDVRFVVHSHDTSRTTYVVRIGVSDGGQLRERTETVTLEPLEQRSLSLVVPEVSDRWTTIDINLVDTVDHIRWLRIPGEQKVQR